MNWGRAKLGGLGVAVVLGALLSGCGVRAPAPQQPAHSYDYSLSVDVGPHDSKEAVGALYGGDVVVWQPEAGFAVVGLSGPVLSTLSDGGAGGNADENKGVMSVPEASSRGAWSSGYSAWAGGWDAWSGGRDVWAGGRDVWADGQPNTFAENLGVWDQINLPEGQALAPHLGAGVKVAVIDTGIDLSHPAFAGKLAPRDEWIDFVGEDAYPAEVNGSAYGHGTGVAGVIVQVAPNVTILPLRVLDPDGSGDLIDVTVAVVWAVAQGADVINLSLGSDTDFRTLKDVLRYAKQEGVIVVASAGNSGQESVEYPARYSAEVIGVGSVDAHDIKSSFSSWGKGLKLLAPGENILTPAPERSLASWSGTSFAAPMVTGSLALALGEAKGNPDVNLDDFIKDVANASADISKQGGNASFGELGHGRLDVEVFLLKVSR